MIVCLETSPLIWLVQGAAKSGQQGLIPRVTEYVRRAQQAGDRIAVPAPVLFEFLAGIPQPSGRQSVAQFIQASFVVPPFDARAAALAAELQADRERFLAAKTAAGGKQPAKFDAAVVGSAVAFGAEVLLTNDPHLVQLAAGQPIRVVVVSDLPASQPQLFDDTGTG